MVIDKNGVTRIYEPKTNTFGSYNSNGTTRTFFKPREGANYFRQEIERALKRGGGRIINPLPETVEPVVPEVLPSEIFAAPIEPEIIPDIPFLP